MSWVLSVQETGSSISDVHEPWGVISRDSSPETNTPRGLNLMTLSTHVWTSHACGFVNGMVLVRRHQAVHRDGDTGTERETPPFNRR